MFKKSKLSDADIIDIMTDTLSTNKQLAARYNISDVYISNIRHGRKCKHISLDPKYKQPSYPRKTAKKLTEAAVIDIMTDHKASAKELAARHGVALTQIYEIHKGKIWKHVTCNYTPRKFDGQVRKLNVEIVTAIKNGEVTDYEAVAKEYGVTVEHLRKLRYVNYVYSWKTIPVKNKVLTIRK